MDASADMRAANVEPLELYPGSSVPWRSKCLICGNEVAPRLASIRRHQSGCKFCAGKAIDKPKVTEGLAAMGFTVLGQIKSSKQRLKVHCSKCMQDVEILHGQVLSGHSGCPGCAKSTFSTTKAAYLYVLSHEEFLAYKVGIMNTGTTRLAIMGRHGWGVITKFKFDRGRQAKDAETNVLRWVRLELQLPAYLSREQMPYRGEQETFSADGVSTQRLLEKVRDVSRQFGGVEE